MAGVMPTSFGSRAAASHSQRPNTLLKVGRGGCAGGRTPYELGLDGDAYPLERILGAAERASSDGPAPALARDLEDPDPAVRYWAATGLLIRGAAAVRGACDELAAALADPSPSVRVAAAEALARFGPEGDLEPAVEALLAAADQGEHGLFTAIEALNALDALGERARPWLERIRALPREDPGVPARLANYVPRLLDAIGEDLERAPPDPAPAARELVYARPGGTPLSLFVHAPAGAAPAGGRPAVVFFHGGGWQSGDPSQFTDHCAHLVRRGLVGISAAYRLGRDHAGAPFVCVADGKRALRWVRAHADELGVDPLRVAAAGGSAGGHVAAALATVGEQPEDADPPAAPGVSCVPNALILFNPVFDNGPGGYGHARFGERWEALSPLHNLRPGAPPSLVLLGTEDALVPVETARRWEARCREVGSRCELVLYEGQPHGFFNRGRSEAMYAATVAEMDAFLDSLGWTAAD